MFTKAEAGRLPASFRQILHIAIFIDVCETLCEFRLALGKGFGPKCINIVIH